MHRSWYLLSSSVAVAVLAFVSRPAASNAPGAPQIVSGVIGGVSGGSVEGQIPARDRVQGPEPTGTSRLTVTVVAADSGAPIKRVRLTLMGMIPAPRPAGGAPGVVPGEAGVTTSLQLAGPGSGPQAPGRLQRDAETDERGRAEFTGLPAASFSLMAMPNAGYVRSRQSQPVLLKDGEAATLTIRLERAGAVTGRIVDETGDPVARVWVRALKRDSTGGMSRLGTAGSATTDDLGQFRVFDLAPGDYFITATYSNPLSQMSSAGLRVGFAPTYYPNAASIDGARPLAVRAGQDTPGVDFALLRAKLGRILGTATDSTGSPIGGRGGDISLSSRSDDQAGGPGRSALVLPDGTFAIAEVPPGDYYLVASFYRGEGPTAEREGAFVPVSVNGEDVTTSIQTNTGATLSGRIVTEGTGLGMPTGAGALAPGGRGAQPGTGAPRLGVGVRPATMGGFGSAFSSGKPATTSEGGTFEITGVRGSVLLTASGGPGMLKAVRRGGDDITGTPLNLTGTERVNDLVIVLTTDSATLQGSATDSRGEPAGGAWVIVFPDDPSRWFAGSPFIRTTRTVTTAPSTAVAPGATPPPGLSSLPRSPGQFTAPRLIAGRYLVVAIEGGDSSTMPPYDSEVLTKLRPQATSVTLTAGQTATVDVGAVKLPPG